MSTEAEAKNLEAIHNAITYHDERCVGQLIEIRMCEFELERLGWTVLWGLPVVGDEKMGTGRFRLVCEFDPDQQNVVEDEMELVPPLMV